MICSSSIPGVSPANSFRSRRGTARSYERLRVRGPDSQPTVGPVSRGGSRSEARPLIPDSFQGVRSPPDDRDGLERLTGYLLRPPVSLERLQVDEHALAIAYAARCKSGLQAPTAAAPVDPKDFLARVVMHIPDPRRHVIRYYGAYSNVARARRARQTAAAGSAGAEVVPSPPAVPVPSDADARALRRRWAQLIRRIFEVDPLICPRCGGKMRIIAFITEPRVIGKILRHLAEKGADARSPPAAPTDIDAA